MADDKPIRTQEELDIGKNIQRLRIKSGFKNQEELAEAYGCSKNYIGILESGFRRPGRKTAKKLAKIFGCDMWNILRPPEPYVQDDARPHKDGEVIPGSYGTPDLSKQRFIKIGTPTKEDVRNRLISQLDKIMDHPTLETAIAANLAAFSKVAEYEARIAALEKELEELRLKVKILSERAMCERPVAYGAMEKQGEQSDGGQP